MLGFRSILIFLIVAAVTAAGWRIYHNIKESGKQEVRTEITQQNQKLDEHVGQVNEEVTRRVINETHIIERRSREVEDVINEQPSEPLTNVTRARLERVREQQRAISEANSKAE